MLNDREEATCCGGNVVLVTGSGDEPANFDEIAADLDRSGAAVHTIAFPADGAFLRLGHLSSLSSSASRTALALSVPESASHQSAVTQARLTAALLQLLRHDRDDAPAQVNPSSILMRTILP